MTQCTTGELVHLPHTYNLMQTSGKVSLPTTLFISMLKVAKITFNTTPNKFTTLRYTHIRTFSYNYSWGQEPRDLRFLSAGTTHHEGHWGRQFLVSAAPTGGDPGQLHPGPARSADQDHHSQRLDSETGRWGSAARPEIIYVSLFCVCVSVCLSLCLSVCPSIFLSVYLSLSQFIYLSVSFSVSLSVCLSLSLSIIICLSICLCIWLCIWDSFFHMHMYICTCLSSSSVGCSFHQKFSGIHPVLFPLDEQFTDERVSSALCHQTLGLLLGQNPFSALCSSWKKRQLYYRYIYIHVHVGVYTCTCVRVCLVCLFVFCYCVLYMIVMYRYMHMACNIKKSLLQKKRLISKFYISCIQSLLENITKLF